MKRAALVAIAVLLFVACHGEPKEKPLSEPGEKLYALTGRIVSREPRANSLMVDHKAIPGFMDAMTMEYSVRGPKVAELPPDNTNIEAKLHVTDRGYWLTDVKKAP